MPELSQKAPVLKKFGVVPFRYSDGEREIRLRCQVRFLRAVLHELKSKNPGVSLSTRTRAWRNGFSTRAWLLYQLERNDHGQYLNDITSRRRLYRINGFFNPLIDNKLIFYRLASRHGIPHSKIIASIVRGRLYLEAAQPGGSPAAVLPGLLMEHSKLVFKPTWAGGGQGIFFLEANARGLKLNGHDVTAFELADILSDLDRYVVTEYLEQASYARTIFAGSANTLRVLTLWDYENDTPFIAAVVHRFGSPRSAPLDNWHGGKWGVCASVDVNGSTLGKAAWMAEDMNLTWSSEHPDTGAPIQGVGIPGLTACLEGVTAAAALFPNCPLIGWDVVLTEQGFCVLEANPEPSFRVWQVHQPLFADERNRAFFRHWGLAR